MFERRSHGVCDICDGTCGSCDAGACRTGCVTHIPHAKPEMYTRTLKEAGA